MCVTNEGVCSASGDDPWVLPVPYAQMAGALSCPHEKYVLMELASVIICDVRVCILSTCPADYNHPLIPVSWYRGPGWWQPDL